MLQTFDKAIKLHQTACFYNELRGYPYIFCTFLLFLRIKLTNILNYYLYLPQQKTVSSAISISGCNGAGKTTASFTILPEMLKCKEFVNSDEIAKGLSPFNSDSIAVAVEASRIMYKRIKELIASGETFAMETTLATRSGANLIREAQREGYYVTLLYFWLNTPDLAVERVKMRVAAGGHNIPESTIRRRYEAGIHNLFELYIPICDYWMIADNSMSPMEVIAKGFRSDKKEIYNSDIYTKLEHHE
jgi:predicted ABC-type ATPase